MARGLECVLLWSRDCLKSLRRLKHLRKESGGLRVFCAPTGFTGLWLHRGQPRPRPARAVDPAGWKQNSGAS